MTGGGGLVGGVGQGEVNTPVTGGAQWFVIGLQSDLQTSSCYFQCKMGSKTVSNHFKHVLGFRNHRKSIFHIFVGQKMAQIDHLTSYSGLLVYFQMVNMI